MSTRRIPFRGAAGAAPLVLGALSALIVVNCAVAAVAMPDVLARLWRNPDIASSAAIAQAMGARPPGTGVVLGDYPWYEPLLAMTATAGLPGAADWWRWGAVACGIVAVALLAWAVALAAGRLAGLVTGALLACLAPAMPSALLVPNAHGAVMLHMSLLLMATVWLARRRPSTLRAPIVLGLVMGCVLGPGLTDGLAIPATLVPLVVLGSWAGMRRRSQVYRALFSYCAVAVGAALVSAATFLMLMHAWRVIPTRGITSWLHLNHAIPGRIATAWNALGDLLVGPVSPSPAGWSFVAVSGLALIVVAVLAIAVAGCVRYARRRTTGGTSGVAPAAAGSIPSWTAKVFLGTAAATGIATFVIVHSQPASRYLAPAAFALAGLVGIAVASGDVRVGRWHPVRIGALIVLVALTAMNVATWRPPDTSPSIARQVAAFVSAHGAKRGYAGYAVASPLTVESGFRVAIRPVQVGPHGLLPSPLHRIDSWYRPDGATAGFVITDAGPVAGPVWAGRIGPDALAGLGPPIARRRFGDQVVSVYPFDIATRLGGQRPLPARSSAAPRHYDPGA